jgi:hypothetical protein
MEDSEAVKVLVAMLEKYRLNDTEKEAIKQAVGVLGWTKLVEGFNERRKRARDKRLSDNDAI